MEEVKKITKTVQMNGKPVEIIMTEMMRPKTQEELDAMTPEERRRPELLNASRKRRIAAGSGTRVEEINRLLKSYEQTKSLLKRFNKNPKAFGGMGGMNGLGM